MYPNLGESIQSICESASENKLVVEYFIEDIINKMVTMDTEISTNNIEYRINRKKIDELPITIRILMINKLIRNSSWRKHDWNEINRIMNSAKIGKIYNFQNIELLKDRKEWIIRPKFNVKSDSITVKLGDKFQFYNVHFNICNIDDFKITDDHNIEVIDGDYIKNKELILRNWQNGDIFLPLGMHGYKKVSDYLTDLKINLFDKQKQLVLTADNEIIWLCGKRISEKVKIKNTTRQYVELSISAKVF